VLRKLRELLSVDRNSEIIARVEALIR
jgi:hypothetical protein